jgi:voltage-gated potassium channel
MGGLMPWRPTRLKRKRDRGLGDPANRLKLAAGSLCGLMVVGTVGYRLIEPGYTVFDGFYMTLITVSTVGFTEVHEMSQGGRIFTSALILVGMVLVAFAIGSFLESVVEGELAEFLGRRRVTREIENLQDHWIICGFGRMGAYVAHELMDSKRKPGFVILELNEERRLAAEVEGFLTLNGDATLDETLQEAGIERACGLVSLVRTDAENVFICLTARQLNPRLRIIARALEETSENKLLRAGADKVIAPYYVGGLRLSQAILRPAVQDFIDFAMGRDLEINMEEIFISHGSPLVGTALKDSPIRTELDLILVAVKRAEGKMLFNPAATTVIMDGDTLIAVGSSENLHRLQARCG